MPSPTPRAHAIRRLVVGLVIAQSACGGGADITPTVVTPVVPTVGTLVVIVDRLGNGADADGFSAAVDGRKVALTTATAARFDSLTPGAHVARIDGVAQQCFASADSVVATIAAGRTDTARVAVTCYGGLAYHQITGVGEYQVAVLTEDGRTVRLTSGPGHKFIDGWSPDGSRLLFNNDASGKRHLFTVGADGTGLRQVSSGSTDDFRARWSPDGSRIAYWALGGNPVDQIVVMDADGSNARSLAFGQRLVWDPVWSLDGKQLYFSCTGADLCTSAPDGTGLREIRYAALVGPPCASVCVTEPPQHWELSRDGRALTFVTYGLTANPTEGMWIGAADGSSARPATPGVQSFDSRWSPTADRVLVSLSNAAYQFALATVNQDGTGFRQLTAFPDRDESANWSPDGTLIGFDGYRSGEQQLWAMNADGTGAHRLTSDGGFGPVWNPSSRPGGPFAGGDRVTASGDPARSVGARGDAEDPLASLLSRGSCRVLGVGAFHQVVCRR